MEPTPISVSIPAPSQTPAQRLRLIFSEIARHEAELNELHDMLKVELGKVRQELKSQERKLNALRQELKNVEEEYANLDQEVKEQLRDPATCEAIRLYQNLDPIMRDAYDLRNYSIELAKQVGDAERAVARLRKGLDWNVSKGRDHVEDLQIKIEEMNTMLARFNV